MMLVINYTQFPIITDLDPLYHSLSNSVNLVPNNPFTDINRAIILNVLLTIPFGFLLPFLKSVNFKKIGIYGIVLTLSIESLQLIVYLLLGAHNRFIDINDIFSNFIGVICGYFLFKIFCGFVISSINKYNIETNSILEFICNASKIYVSNK
ncbi:VanZ family protein [Caldalkalibacillus mannanilyticus]|uniref:VanZ family protein n=1 Tax=Caldalkalibacillus mannanilyticus TaxID=1418 RepID=UPI0034E2B1A3